MEDMTKYFGLLFSGTRCIFGLLQLWWLDMAPFSFVYNIVLNTFSDREIYIR